MKFFKSRCCLLSLSSPLFFGAWMVSSRPGKTGFPSFFHLNNDFFCHFHTSLNFFSLIFVELSKVADSLLLDFSINSDVFDNPNRDPVIFLFYQSDKHGFRFREEGGQVNPRGHYKIAFRKSFFKSLKSIKK